MKNSKDKGLVLNPATGELEEVTRYQETSQWMYGATEPIILRATDFMIKTPGRAKAFNKLSTPNFMPREVVITTEAACRFIDYIYAINGENTSARMAVTKCVCQTATNNYREPVKKDMALLYTANMYTTLKHTGIAEPYDIIETAEEAKEMIRYFDSCNLVHTVLYCHNSGTWTFVLCNCDDVICIPMRAFKTGRMDQVLKGPEVISFDQSKCDKCGKCIERCMFNFNVLGDDGKIYCDTTSCLGCGLCAGTCPSGARTMVRRPDYRHEDKVTTKILLGEE